jgi:hypothetical protein
MDLAKQAQLIQLAEDIAEALPGQWDVEPFPEDWSRAGAYLIEPKTQAKLSVGESQEYSERNKQKLTVSTDYPRTHDGNTSSARRPKISVSALKTGAQIARDIERRLLPEYLPLLEKEIASNESWREYEGKTTLIATHIANVVKVQRQPKETTVSFYRSPYNIFAQTMSEAKVVGGDEVELTLRLDPETTLKVLNLLIHGRFELPETAR